MTKTIIFAAGLAVASSASADLTGATHANLLDPSIYTLHATAIDAPSIAGLHAIAYANIDTNIGAFAVAGGVVASDDYTSIATGTIDMDAFRFIGGVDTSGGVAFFEFYDAASAFATSFGVALPQAGDFLWTITINSFPGGQLVPNVGTMQMVVDDAGAFGPATLGRMFVADDGAEIGSTVPGTNLFADFDHTFEISGDFVPAPASVALLGLGGFAAVRRRR